MSDTYFIDADIEQAEQDLQLLSGMMRNCIMMNASATLTEEEYRRQYTELTGQYETRKAEYEALLEHIKVMENTAILFGGILFQLMELEELPVEFDETLWNTLVDHAAVYADERIVFTFMDGTEVETVIER